MSAPLDFFRLFAGRLEQAGIRYALTSGMACVRYGLQQTTKDTDWIIAPTDLGKFRVLLENLEHETHPWRVTYRSIFGAPLEEEYLAHGWTSHLEVQEPDGCVQKVDLFGQPPRVVRWEPAAEGVASRQVVALMKRTDRDKDWPHVDSLGAQLAEHGHPDAVLHLQTPDWLLEAWRRVATEDRPRLIFERPLLGQLDHQPHKVKRLLLLERLLWMAVDAERYRVYRNCWKEFVRRAKNAADVLQARPFAEQHRQLLALCRNGQLESDPLATAGRANLLARAGQEVLDQAAATPEELARVQPPLQSLLP